MSPALRFLLLGPITGGLVAIMQTSAAVTYWLAAGEPDFFFRNGWDGVATQYVLLTVGGGMAGTLYGMVLFIFERRCERRIPLSTVIPALMVIAFLLSLVTTFLSLHLLDARWASLDQFLVVVVGFAISIALSRRVASPVGHRPPGGCSM